MAYVVRRPGGRWEIRESYASSRGPRARTLATFKTLSPEVVERAANAAHRPFDTAGLLRSARRAGVPSVSNEADGLAGTLIRVLARGAHVRPGLRRLLWDALKPGMAPAADDAVAEWIGASLEERADALVQLLELADSLPHHRPGPLRFPKLSVGATP